MRRLLVIDDDPDVCTIISAFFHKNGFDVTTASHNEDAWKKVQQFAPQVILLDVLLSGSDGREFCRRLKANPETKHITVIMFSAHPGAAGQISDYGADDFVPKPFHLHSLLQRVLSHIGATA